MKRKTNRGIDLAKFICAVLIVFMHTYCWDGGVVGNWTKNVLAEISVPFFFITSGFFFRKGLSNNQTSEYLKQYVLKTALTYAFWSAVTLPVSWMVITRSHSDYSFALKVIYLFRMFFLSGTVGIYWYVLSLIYDAILIYCCSKNKKLNIFLYVAACVLFIIGTLYNANLLPVPFVSRLIHVVFGSERNFLNVGLFYMLLGAWLSRTTFSAKPWIYFCAMLLSLVLHTLFVRIYHFRIMQAFSATALFLFVYNYSFHISESLSLKLRSISKALYFGHFPVILLYDFNLKNGSLEDFTVASGISILMYMLIVRFFPKKIAEIAYRG